MNKIRRLTADWQRTENSMSKEGVRQLSEALQIETAQVQAMNAEYEKLKRTEGTEIYILLINRKLGIVKKFNLDEL